MACYSESFLTEEELSCPICLEEYDIYSSPRVPKLLDCLHTYCFQCIGSLQEAGKIKCCICRFEHLNFNVQNLLDNYVIIEYLRKKQIMEDEEFARHQANALDQSNLGGSLRDSSSNVAFSPLNPELIDCSIITLSSDTDEGSVHDLNNSEGAGSALEACDETSNDPSSNNSIADASDLISSSTSDSVNGTFTESQDEDGVSGSNASENEFASVMCRQLENLEESTDSRTDPCTEHQEVIIGVTDATCDSRHKDTNSDSSDDGCYYSL